MQVKNNLRTDLSSIRTLGFNLVWRNSNTVRYLRLNVWLWRASFTMDFFRKDKVLDRLAKYEANTNNR